MKTFWKCKVNSCQENGKEVISEEAETESFGRTCLLGRAAVWAPTAAGGEKCLSCWKGCLTTGRLKLASSEQGFKKFTLKFLQNLWNYPALPDFPCYLYKMKSKKKKEKTILHTTGTILFNDSSLCLCKRGSIEEKQLQYWIVYNIIKAQGIEQVGGHYRTITLSTLLRTSCPSLIRLWSCHKWQMGPRVFCGMK